MTYPSRDVKSSSCGRPPRRFAVTQCEGFPPLEFKGWQVESSVIYDERNHCRCRSLFRTIEGKFVLAVIFSIPPRVEEDGYVDIEDDTVLLTASISDSRERCEAEVEGEIRRFLEGEAPTLVEFAIFDALTSIGEGHC